MLSRMVLQRLRASSGALVPSTMSILQMEESLHTTGARQMVTGECYRKEPAKLRMEKGKTYKWCACGLSNEQPFCDGSHKNSKKGLKPLQFTPDVTKEYELCNCKQTSKRPFCDGHKCKC